ncbi:MAG TPA: hypothetical protein PKO06_19085, partial [Candidatus Ozemobacteraceae bacterium]|nr:hypothetical protein [Candidatus Ozemobacteraceae bacterium]
IDMTGNTPHSEKLQVPADRMSGTSKTAVLKDVASHEIVLQPVTDEPETATPCGTDLTACSLEIAREPVVETGSLNEAHDPIDESKKTVPSWRVTKPMQLGQIPAWLQGPDSASAKPTRTRREHKRKTLLEMFSTPLWEDNL